MGLFRKIINKKAAIRIAEKINFPQEEIFEVLMASPNFDEKNFYNYVCKKRSEIKKIPVDIYLRILKEQGKYLTYEECCQRYYAEKAELTLDEYKSFIEFKEKNIGIKDINNDNVLDYYKAKLLELDIEYYYKYIARDDITLSPKAFMNIEKAKEKGISLSEYLDIIEAKKLKISVKEYKDYLIAKSKGLSIDTYYYLNYLKSQHFCSNDFIPVSNNFELLAAKEAKFNNIFLLKNFTNIDYDESLFNSDMNVIISNGVEKINPLLIKNLKQETIIIPPTVKNINDNFFNAILDSKIKNIYILSEIDINKQYDLKDKKLYLLNNVYDKCNDSFKGEINKIIFDKKLSSIGAFVVNNERKCYFVPGTNINKDLSVLNDYEIVNIEISHCVNIINKNAFINLSNIKHFIIKDEQFNSNELSFSEGSSIIDCNSIHKNVVSNIKGNNITFNDVLLIDEETTEIYDYEYYGLDCKSVIIPKSVKKIGEKAFANSSVTKVYFKGSLNYKKNSFLNCKIQNIYQDVPFINSPLGIIGNNISTIDLEGITIIKKSAFENYDLQKIEIPNSVKEIESFAITSKNDLNVIINGDVKLHKNAFGKKIKSLFFKNISKDNIFDFLKNSEMNLQSITLPSDVDIETFTAVFTCIKNIENIYITGNKSPSLRNRGIFNTSINSQIKHIEFPECVSQIGISAFDNYEIKIKKLIFPDNILKFPFSSFIFKDKTVNVIGSKELVNMMSQKVELKFETLNPVLIDSILIEKMDDFYSIPLEKRSLIKNVIIGAEIEEIPSYGLAHMCHLEVVTIEGLIKKIGKYAFAYCNRLKKIELSPTVSEICEGAFLGDINLENIKGFDSVEIVRERVFEGCEKLESLVFSPSIRIIENCIKGCSNLKLFVVPSSCDKVDITFDAKGTVVYLPRYIKNCNLVTYLNIHDMPKVHCPKTKNWSFSSSYQGYIHYKISDFKDAVNKIIESYGFFISEIENKKNLEKSSYREVIDQDTPFYKLNLSSNEVETVRASFSTLSKNESIEEFSYIPSSINDVIEENDIDTEVEIKEVERKNDVGSYELIKDKTLISFENKLITNNVFTISLNINEELNDIYVCVINEQGISATGLYKVFLDKKKCFAKINMTLLPGQKNGKYYFVAALSDIIENSIIYKEEVEIKISFALDDDFDL